MALIRIAGDDVHDVLLQLLILRLGFLQDGDVGVGALPRPRSSAQIAESLGLPRAGFLNGLLAIVRSGQHFIKTPVAMQISDQRV